MAPEAAPDPFRGRFIHRIPAVRRESGLVLHFGGADFTSEDALREHIRREYGTEVLILDANSVTLDVLESELRKNLPTDMADAFLAEVRAKGLNPVEERIVLSKKG